MYSASRRAPAVPPLFRLLRNGSLAATTASRSIAEDPLTFGIQLARRFPAARQPLQFVSSAAVAADRDLVNIWLAGDVASTRAQLDALARHGLSRLAAEVAQAAGRPELVATDERIDPVARARALWQLGAATKAIGLLEEHRRNSRLHRAFRAELALMTPGTRLRWTPPSVERAPSTRGAILHLLTNSLPHTQSGYTLRSHAVLKAQRAARLQPTAMTRVGYPVVVGGLGARAADAIDGIRYHRALPATLARTPDGRLVQQADALLRLAQAEQPEWVQTTTHYPNAIVARQVAEALGLPWAYEVRGMLEQTWVASLGSTEARDAAVDSERFRLVREREAELASAADAVFTLSGGMRDDLVTRGVPRDSISLVPNGIDDALLERASVAPAEDRVSLGLPREGFWVGSTSSLVDYEGFHVLIEAISIARASGADIRLLLVGDGAARPSLAAQASSMLGQAFHMPGRVPRDEVDRWRDALDVVVVPRLDLDVTRTVAPLKPIEAMAAGKPLLVSALPPLLEVVGTDLVGAGAAVPAGDPTALADRLLQLHADPTMRSALGALGRAAAARRAWSSIGQTYAEVLGRVRA